MAVVVHTPIKDFDGWYKSRRESADGCMDQGFALTEQATAIRRRFERVRTEMKARLAGYENLEKLADGDVITPKPDLPNVSSGETAGIVRRVARNLVQHTPNVIVKSVFDDDSAAGIFSRHVLLTRIIGDDLYSNDMQQNLFASVKSAFTIGFNCVIPVLLQDARGSWYMKYDSIHYRDVFPEIEAKDIRQANEVFIRRYLSKGDVRHLIRNKATGWDESALRALLKNSPSSYDMGSTPRQTHKHGASPEGYEIVTLYTNSGDPFLTFDPNSGMLLRIEKNKHPLKQHPVHFLVLEKDELQPLGKSQVELLVGRQEFQDLMLNGAMKMWYRDINPTFIGYGADGGVPNLSPGQFYNMRNPKGRLEPLNVNTTTLMQYGLITQQNQGAMINLVGSSDQQMAVQAGNGMSATPQGVEAQQALVDITTNNYQKAIESFFSHYCSYALTLYFAELKNSSSQPPTITADTRQKLLDAKMPAEAIDENGALNIDFSDLAVEYNVQCIPGSLVELEDDKQIRILNGLFVSLSQAMPAISATNNPEMLANAAATLNYIIGKNIEMSGSSSAEALKTVFNEGVTPQLTAYEEKIASVEEGFGSLGTELTRGLSSVASVVSNMQAQLTQQQEVLEAVISRIGGQNNGSTPAAPRTSVS